MKTIVAATDFSPISENAVRYAADLAVSLGTRLALIHVYTIPVVVGDMPIPANSLKEAEANTIKQLETLRDNLTTRTGTRIEIRLVARPGDVVRQLEDYCNEIKP